MTIQLAIEKNTDWEDVSFEDQDSLPPSPNIPLKAFLLYNTPKEKNKSDDLRRTVSVPDIDQAKANKTSSPVRRFSVCDLDTVDPQCPISPSEGLRTQEYFGSNHHRRNSVALKFGSPRLMNQTTSK